MASIVNNMPTSNKKGRGLLKKPEKERIKFALNKKKRKMKRASQRATLLEKHQKLTAENLKKTEEKLKNYGTKTKQPTDVNKLYCNSVYVLESNVKIY